MCEVVDNWLSVFHFIVFGDDWQVQQHDCCPFNELLFPFVFITFQIYITASDFCDFPCSFQCTKKKKPILYLREDERMEEFKFIDNRIHFFLSDQSSWLDVLVCLIAMNIITLLKQNDIYETISMMICFVSKGWK